MRLCFFRRALDITQTREILTWRLRGRPCEYSLVSVLGDHSTHLVNRGTDCLYSGLSLQGGLYSEQQWQIGTINEAKCRYVYSVGRWRVKQSITTCYYLL